MTLLGNRKHDRLEPFIGSFYYPHYLLVTTCTLSALLILRELKCPAHIIPPLWCFGTQTYLSPIMLSISTANLVSAVALGSMLTGFVLPVAVGPRVNSVKCGGAASLLLQIARSLGS
jgi:hypothetical protein